MFPEQPFHYQRRKSSEVTIGAIPLGGENPIRLQSMTNTSTLDTQKSIAQILRIADAGADYVRLTAQGEREARNLADIRSGVHAHRYTTPLIADIHFNPKAAFVAAEHVEKVRINPGNFAENSSSSLCDEATGLAAIRERLLPLLQKCRTHNTALRIGVNHGSLSERILSQYGNTPQGMVASCMEYLRICRDENFHQIVLSIKASDTTLMVYTVRLLVESMEKEKMAYPLHLGVTEAGEGEDGRIKSAIGIGTLLMDGIGDTIRVSLSEAPEAEIPVAKELVSYTHNRIRQTPISATPSPLYQWSNPQKRTTYTVDQIGGEKPPIVISDRSRQNDLTFDAEARPDYLYIGTQPTEIWQPMQLPLIVDAQNYTQAPNIYPLFQIKEANPTQLSFTQTLFLAGTHTDLTQPWIETLRIHPNLVFVHTPQTDNPIGERRALHHLLLDHRIQTPVILTQTYQEEHLADLQLHAAVDLGSSLIDRFGEGLFLQNNGSPTPTTIDKTLFAILQATRSRSFRTEYISCPGCGRTLYDLPATIARIKAATSHLKGVRIAIMGCIVNGPGEMADADFGYVGAGRGCISLYQGKNCLERNIPETEAVDHLITLIKSAGAWQEPPLS